MLNNNSGNYENVDSIHKSIVAVSADPTTGIVTNNLVINSTVPELSKDPGGGPSFIYYGQIHLQDHLGDAKATFFTFDLTFLHPCRTLSLPNLMIGNI